MLYLKLGTGASSSDYHITLSACSSAADGTGGIFTNDGYQGAVSVAASGTPSYSVIEYQKNAVALEQDGSRKDAARQCFPAATGLK